jgi:hypothetical protein
MFKVGDRVVRCNMPYRDVRIGDTGTVVKVTRNNLRVRYDRHVSQYGDGCFGQLPQNLYPVIGEFGPVSVLPVEQRAAAMNAVIRSMMDSAAIADHPQVFIHSNPPSEYSARRWAEMEKVLYPPEPSKRDHLLDAMRYAHNMVEAPHRDPCPALGPDLGMFLRDGMSLAAARLALANARALADAAHKERRLPKVRATLPGTKSITVHKAPRAWGWLNVKLGIGSSQHVQWEVAAPLDAFGRET